MDTAPPSAQPLELNLVDKTPWVASLWREGSLHPRSRALPSRSQFQSLAEFPGRVGSKTLSETLTEFHSAILNCAGLAKLVGLRQIQSFLGVLGNLPGARGKFGSSLSIGYLRSVPSRDRAAS